MNEHEELQLGIPAYIAGRAEGEALRSMEEHLRACDGCRELAATWKEFRSTLREEGADLFGAHPLEMALREYAVDAAPDGAAIARHLETCATCDLEVRFWKSARHSSARSTWSDSVRRRGALSMSAWSAAAGLLVGVGLVYLFQLGGGWSDPGSRDSVIDGSTAAAVQGRLPQVILPRAVRGAGVEREVRLGAKDRHLIVAVQVTLPDQPDFADSFRFEIHDRNGRMVWSTDVAAATIRADIDANEVISLVVPVGSLTSQRYSFLSGMLSASGKFEVLSRATIVISRSDG